MSKVFKFFSNKHYKLERFITVMAILFTAMTLLSGFIYAEKLRQDDEMLGEKSIYTTQAEMSLTGNILTVENIFRDEDNTRIFILMKFENPQSMSLNAEHYRTFLTAVDLKGKQINPKNKPTMSLHMFGTTGYMGFYFTNPSGFTPEIMSLTLRSDVQIEKKQDVKEDENNVDASFSQYDQARILFNPAGKNAVSADFLNTDEALPVNQIYESTVTRYREADIRKELNEKLSEMFVLKNKMDEYKDRLIRQNVAVPEAPLMVDQDVITYDKDFDIYDFETPYTAPKGFNFNWQDYRVMDGYIEYLKGDLTNEQFMAKKAAEQGDRNEVRTVKTGWKYVNGSDTGYNGSGASEITSLASLYGDIRTLESTWEEYITLRDSYEVNSLRKLILLELEALDADKNYSINQSEDVLTIY